MPELKSIQLVKGASSVITDTLSRLVLVILLTKTIKIAACVDDRLLTSRPQGV